MPRPSHALSARPRAPAARWISLLLLLAATVGVAHGRSRVAVLALTNSADLSDREASWLTDVLRAVALEQLGADHDILTRTQLVSLLPPDVDPAECADDCELTLGRHLGAEAVVSGELLRLGDRYTLAIRLFAVADRTLLAVVHGEARTAAGLEPALRVAGLQLLARWRRRQGGGPAVEAAPLLAVGPVPGGTLHIEAHEVTVAAWRACVAAGACTTDGATGEPLCNVHRPDGADHPMNCVRWTEAAAYCRWRGRRLPTASEWRAAARQAPDPFPWGDGPATCQRAVVYADGEPGCGEGGTAPVRSRPAGAALNGAMDLVGNVREWVRPDDAPEGWRPPAWAMAPALGGAWHHAATARAVTQGVQRLVSASDAMTGLRCAVVRP